MSAREGDWQLVGRDSDPVPGDPVVVGDEARHYSNVAQTISDQVTRLRSLAEPDAALKGHYADELQEGMTELADDLDKIHGRFETAGSQLAVLEPALDTARTKTKAALDAAVDAKAAEDPDKAEQPDAPFAKSQEEQDCDAAMSEFEGVADEVAAKIRSASDDDMKDSTWDKFKNAVAAIAPVLKILAKVLSYVALALTVIAMFIPGLNVLVLVLVLTAASLLINTLLASTGNGSWVDVAFDVVGLLTLGIGSKALAIAKVARTATLTRAATTSAMSARSAAFARTAWNGGRGLRGLVSLLRPSVRTAMRTSYADEFARVMSRPIPTAVTPASLLKSGGDRGVAAMMDDLAGIRAEFPGVDVAVNHARGIDAAAISSVTGLTGSGVQAAPDVVGGIDLVTGGK
jgi:uncharacterized membrane protein